MVTEYAELERRKSSVRELSKSMGRYRSPNQYTFGGGCLQNSGKYSISTYTQHMTKAYQDQHILHSRSELYRSVDSILG